MKLDFDKIHKSHKMEKWYDTVVTIISTSRFGRLRRCKVCKAEQVSTAAGDAMHDELRVKCVGYEII